MTENRKKWMKRAAIAAAVLGVVCPHLPPDYRPLCTAVASIAKLSC